MTVALSRVAEATTTDLDDQLRARRERQRDAADRADAIRGECEETGKQIAALWAKLEEGKREQDRLAKEINKLMDRERDAKGRIATAEGAVRDLKRSARRDFLHLDTAFVEQQAEQSRVAASVRALECCVQDRQADIDRAEASIKQLGSVFNTPDREERSRQKGIFKNVKRDVADAKKRLVIKQRELEEVRQVWSRLDALSAKAWITEADVEKAVRG